MGGRPPRCGANVCLIFLTTDSILLSRPANSVSYCPIEASGNFRSLSAVPRKRSRRCFSNMADKSRIGGLPKNALLNRCVLAIQARDQSLQKLFPHSHSFDPSGLKLKRGFGPNGTQSSPGFLLPGHIRTPGFAPDGLIDTWIFGHSRFIQALPGSAGRRK